MNELTSHYAARSRNLARAAYEQNRRDKLQQALASLERLDYALRCNSGNTTECGEQKPATFKMADGKPYHIRIARRRD